MLSVLREPDRPKKMRGGEPHPAAHGIWDDRPHGTTHGMQVQRLFRHPPRCESPDLARGVALFALFSGVRHFAHVDVEPRGIPHHFPTKRIEVPA